MHGGKPRSGISDHLREDRGAIAILAAGVLAISIALMALVIDLGFRHMRQQDLQGAVDAAAMAAIQDPENREARARATLDANGFTGVEIDVSGEQTYSSCEEAGGTYSHIDDDGACAAGATELGFALRVSATDKSPLFFGGIISSLDGLAVGASATAARTEVVGMSVGTRLARIEDGILNDVLSGLTGSNIGLTALDYENLLSVQVDLLSVLGRTAVSAGVGSDGTMADLLGQDIPLTDLVGAVADELAAIETPTLDEDAALGSVVYLEGQLLPDVSFLVRELVGLDPAYTHAPASGNPSLRAGIPILNLLSLAAQASQDDTATIPLELDASVLGLVDLEVVALLGADRQSEPLIRVGGENATIATSQARVKLNVALNVPILGLGSLRVDLPIYTFLADGVATVTDISCAPDGGSTVGVDATPALVRAFIGHLPDPAFENMQGRPESSAPVEIVNGSLLGLSAVRVTGNANLVPDASDTVHLTFTESQIYSEDPEERIQTAGSGLQLGSLLDRLLSDLSLEVHLFGLNLLLVGILTEAVVQNILVAAIGSVFDVLDPVIDGLLVALGVHLGEMDVEIFGLRCAYPNLVQ